MTEAKGLTRREVLANLAATGGMCLIPHRLFASPGFSALTLADRSPLSSSLDKTVPFKVQPFPMTAVRLRPGPFRDAMEINQRYLHSLPNDRLLHAFRLTAGLPSSAEPLGNWENPQRVIPGTNYTFKGAFAGGMYLTACALAYASTGDKALKAKADALVAGLAKCQKAMGLGGYLGAYSTEFYDALLTGNQNWSPMYTYAKILAGHLAMYRHCGNTQALATAERMVAWLAKYMKPINDTQWVSTQQYEFGDMGEVLYILYTITGKDQYRALAQRFDHKAFFDPLAEHRDELSGLHSNTHIPRVIAAARGYEITGESRYREIASYFWQEVTSKRCYCTGGTSTWEFWRDIPLSDADLGHRAEECCCSYNMMKLTRHLFAWTGDPHMMDYYERTLFNARLGTQDREGRLMYYIPLQHGAWKSFGTLFDSFWCCTGTGIEEFAKTNDTIYYHDAKGLYVNLFIASEVHWAEKKVRVVQETNFPEEEGTRLTVRCKRPVQMAVNIRIPYWAGSGVTFTVNDKPYPVTATPSSYVTIDRQWHDGDTIHVTLPMSLHVAPLGDSTWQAMMYGPLALAGRLGPTEGSIVLPQDPGQEFPEMPPPRILTANLGKENWVEVVKGKPLRFKTVGQSPNVDLIPLYQLFDDRYTVYWDVKKS